ncbi:MAG: type II toxin-antitoxin system VapC family toxin [Actinomycetes bacterium]
MTATGRALGGTVVVDAGPLYAAADSGDSNHHRCAAFLASHPGPLVVPQLVIAEVTYLIADRLGTHVELLFLAELVSGGLATEPVDVSDWERITELVTRYRDFPLGTVDASVIACAERIGVTAVATLDHRHFAAVRPTHTEAFTLLPGR